MKIKIGTRPSNLAVAQANMVASSLEAIGIDTEIVKHRSAGDIDTKNPIYSIGKTGVFVQDLNNMILRGEIDVAVHSAKDIPSEIENRLTIAATLKRGSFNDALVSKYDLRSLPISAKVGTSSIRRIFQLKYARQDLKFENIRGNIETRIAKMSELGLDAIVMAEAAIQRLGLNVEYSKLDENKFVPAPNQGIIAVVSKKEGTVRKILEEINDENTFEEMQIERSVVQQLKLGCSTPVGILSRPSGKGHKIIAQFFSMQGDDVSVFEQYLNDLSDVDSLVSYIRENIPREYGYIASEE
ncbi:hydroxymethylbilane synthase [Thermoplasma volcanium GSS1]|uniref:Probable porphobilinogen deaminase n=1 Tax=Thermoplasma volcanium (strain ATCC 51530 / DSM 4299 / JCM 9571 / NBRC 15438 / GSS1) TaxID=273116 RepID=HEM3_THEVO|nr:hydroxymethylbilane synthase [Thermoplasma volcanium]Q97B26.1 RecName: Full=Probable porphobilinogen deaminase; Short=PBG; AltName: Full=Hydroxymethylbilane synthase; Short=HMBS; AltName: Full=Pre-uroporphyrinogen synthase [Thermoplasma volcanium GSS1]BAB59775.1 hydroxymethylbilane synthase [Thermoplasma volcanium GSS1]